MHCRRARADFSRRTESDRGGEPPTWAQERCSEGVRWDCSMRTRGSDLLAAAFLHLI